MRSYLQIFAASLLGLLLEVSSSHAQAPTPVRLVGDVTDGPVLVPCTTPQLQPVPAPSGQAVGIPIIAPFTASPIQAVAVQAEKADDKKGDTLEKKVELLQKQLEVQKKLIDLLAEQMKKRPAGGAEVDDLKAQIATLEARIKQAAQRDQEVTQAVDILTEHIDAEERNGPRLPAALKEMFLASGTNESPLSIYGALSVGYSKITGTSESAANGLGRPATPGGFYFGEFTPDFFLKLNDWILLEAEIGIGSDGSVSAGSFAEADFFVADWLTVSLGRFVAPIGFYNVALNTPWINKLPADVPGAGPLLWQQVLPATSFLGARAEGSFYLGCSPLKLEYQAYVSNGLNLTPATPGAPTLSELANLQNMEDTFTVITDSKAVGGRLALWWPEMGLVGGVSGLYNARYVSGPSPDALSLFAVDLSYHQGNWDIRAEYGAVNQQASTFLRAPIRREGFYGQVAYRPWDCANKYLQRTEAVYRYSYVTFPGIDANELDLTTFGTPMDAPVRRQQNEIGINYYFYPRMVLKLAYQMNDEPKFHLHDNQFVAEFDWGW
jgi:hypothetical protein